MVVSVRFTMIDRSLFLFSACHNLPMVPLQITLYFAHICTLSGVRCGIKLRQSAFKSLNFKIFVSLLAITVLYFLWWFIQTPMIRSWCYFEHVRILLFFSLSNFCASKWLEWNEQTSVLLNLNRQNECKVHNRELSLYYRNFYLRNRITEIYSICVITIYFCFSMKFIWRWTREN